MMQPVGAVKRTWLTLLLGVQLLGVSIPLADARLDGAAAGAVHIEQRTDRSCDPVHLHDDCVLCQHLTAQWAFGARDVCASAAPVVTLPGASRSETRPASTPSFLERGRSPPSI